MGKSSRQRSRAILLCCILVATTLVLFATSKPPARPTRGDKVAPLTLRPRPRRIVQYDDEDLPAPTNARRNVIEQPHQSEIPNCFVDDFIDEGLKDEIAKSNFASDGTHCIDQLEAVSPHPPFQNVDNRCYLNRARWPGSVSDHIAHLDFIEIDRRRRHARFLAGPGECRPAPDSQRHFVYIDLFSQSADDSVKWFLEHYPQANRFVVHAFDFRVKFRESYHELEREMEHRHHGAHVWFRSLMPWNETGKAQITQPCPTRDPHRKPEGSITTSGSDGSTAADSQLTAIDELLCDRYPRVTMNDRGGYQVKDIVSILHEEVTPTDFVVMRMDINGLEWVLLPHIIRGQALGLIDELMLVCHNVEVSVEWNTKTTPRECQVLIHTLRDAGVYVHEWW